MLPFSIYRYLSQDALLLFLLHRGRNPIFVSTGLPKLINPADRVGDCAWFLQIVHDSAEQWGPVPDGSGCLRHFGILSTQERRGLSQLAKGTAEVLDVGALQTHDSLLQRVPSYAVLPRNVAVDRTTKKRHDTPDINPSLHIKRSVTRRQLVQIVIRE